MPKRRKKPPTISDTLRKAIHDNGQSFIGLERETGVLRQTLMPFARGESGINIAAADKLATYFGLTLVPIEEQE